MAGPTRSQPMAETRAAIAQTVPNPTTTAPRPPNAWILYRSEMLRNLPDVAPGQPKRAQADVSRLISTMWKNESTETRLYYERLADEKKAEHSIMYPGYRFTPMKKEDKAALREQRKQVKVNEKKTRQQRGRGSASTQPQASTSTAPMAATIHHQFQPPHIQMFPPMIPGSVYIPMNLFGFAGPSPPVSVASTPEPTGSSSPESTSSEELHDPNAPKSRASTAPLTTLPFPISQPPQPQPNSAPNPYLLYFNPGGNHASAPLPPPPNNFLIVPQTHGSTPATPAVQPTEVEVPQVEPTSSTDLHFSPQLPLNHEPVQMAVPTSHVDQPPADYSLMMDNANHFDTGDGFNFAAQQPQENLSFDVDQDFFSVTNTLVDPDSSAGSNLDALLISDDIFSLNNFSADFLTTAPSGEILVNFGEYVPPEMDFSTFLDMGMLDPTMVSNPSLLLNPVASTSDNTVFEPQNTSNSGDQIGLMELLSTSLEEYSSSSPSTTGSQPSMPPTPLQPALSVDLSNTESQKSTASSYIPPSGAAMSSSRRVGGSWKPPPFISPEGSLDNMSAMLSAQS